MDVNTIRFSIFLGIFLVMLMLENFIPRHFTVDSKLRRLGINLALTGINIMLVRLILGTAAVGTAIYAQEKGWGLLMQVNWPQGCEMGLAVVILDFMIYIQHWIVHRVPLFWRFHIVHHTDLDLDVSSGLRFHPVEILGSMLYKMALILILGPTPTAVMIFEVILNGMAQFTHSNIKLPKMTDRFLRWLIVTPDMHRIHHSIEVDETNSNYGFNLSIWDRILSTYIQNAKKPQPEISIGIEHYRSPEQVSLKNLVLMPFGHPPKNG